MTRLVRLNDVQYAETEHQIAGLVAQGFAPVPLEVAENVAEKIVEVVVAASDTPKKSGGNKGGGKGKGEKIDEGGAEDNPSREGDEQH